MNKQLLNEVINLKEKRRVVQAECFHNINEHTFSKVERQYIKKHRNDDKALLTLHVLNAAIIEDEMILLEH